MATRGKLELYTQSNGWVEIELGDPSQMDFTPIEVETPNGWGAPRVGSPSNADTPLEVYTQSNGWQGIFKKAIQMIDSAEDGDLSEYTDNNNVFSAVQNSTRASDGSYTIKYESSQGGNSAINSTSGLANYPSQGNRFKSDCWLTHSNNGAGVLFGVQDTTNTYPDSYHVEANEENDGSFDIKLEDPGGQQGGTTTLASTSFDPTGYASEFLTFDIDWQTDGTINAKLLDSNGNQIVSVSATDTTWSSGGWGFAASTDASTGSDQVVYQDFARIVS